MTTQISNKYRFSQWLIWEKNQRRMTTSEFAKLCMITPAAITNYLNGINWPPVINLFILSQRLGAEIKICKGELTIKNSKNRWMFVETC